jgi:drug/metabolite transporter (DMT)-like permease
MSLAITLAFIALLVGGVADFLYRIAQDKGISSGVFLFWQSIIFSAILWIYALITGEVAKLDLFTHMVGLPAGAMGFAALTLFIISVKTGDISVNAPIFRLNFVITSAGAMILLGEPVLPLRVLGVVLALLSVFFFAELTSLKVIKNPSRSLVLVSTASIIFGFVGILIKYGLENDIDPIPLLLSQTIAFQIAATINVIVQKSWRPNRATILYSPLVAILQLIWASLTLFALNIADASVIYPIIQLSFIVTAILGFILLKEKLNRSKSIGIIFAITTVGVLSIA